MSDDPTIAVVALHLHHEGDLTGVRTETDGMTVLTDLLLAIVAPADVEVMTYGLSTEIDHLRSATAPRRPLDQREIEMFAVGGRQLLVQSLQRGTPAVRPLRERKRKKGNV